MCFLIWGKTQNNKAEEILLVAFPPLSFIFFFSLFANLGFHFSFMMNLVCLYHIFIFSVLSPRLRADNSEKLAETSGSFSCLSELICTINTFDNSVFLFSCLLLLCSSRRHSISQWLSDIACPGPASVLIIKYL